MPKNTSGLKPFKPNNQASPEEIEMRREGAAKGAAANKSKANTRQYSKEVLENRVKLQPKSIKKLETVGIDPDEPLSVRQAAVLQIAAAAANGDEKAARLLMSWAGETVEAELLETQLKIQKEGTAIAGDDVLVIDLPTVRKKFDALTEEQKQRYIELLELISDREMKEP